jgi:hypothetical protein
MINLSNPTIFAAVLGAALTVIGWGITHIYLSIHDANTRREIARLEYLRKRIEEFYGPLIGIIRQTFLVYEIATQILPIDNNRQIKQIGFQGKDIDAWRFLQENYFFPLNAEAVSLLKTKGYLIGAQIPDSFERVLRHATQFECLYRLWSATGIDNSQKVKGLEWPGEFEGEVLERFESVRAEYLRTLRLLDLLGPSRKH